MKGNDKHQQDGFANFCLRLGETLSKHSSSGMTNRNGTLKGMLSSIQPDEAYAQQQWNAVDELAVKATNDAWEGGLDQVQISTMVEERCGSKWTLSGHERLKPLDMLINTLNRSVSFCKNAAGCRGKASKGREVEHSQEQHLGGVWPSGSPSSLSPCIHRLRACLTGSSPSSPGLPPEALGKVSSSSPACTTFVQNPGLLCCRYQLANSGWISLVLLASEACA